MNSDSPDPIVGNWEFTNNNICTFAAEGDVMLCGSRVGVWKKVKDKHYFVAYLRGHFGGASDPLEIQPDGTSMRGLANGKLTRHLERADDQTDPTSIVGKWDFKNGNIATFTPDGWNELCGIRVGIWVRESERSFLNVYLRGYFGGASDPLVMSEDGKTMEGLINGSWETSTVRRTVD